MVTKFTRDGVLIIAMLSTVASFYPSETGEVPTPLLASPSRSESVLSADKSIIEESVEEGTRETSSFLGSLKEKGISVRDIAKNKWENASPLNRAGGCALGALGLGFLTYGTCKLLRGAFRKLTGLFKSNEFIGLADNNLFDGKQVHTMKDYDIVIPKVADQGTSSTCGIWAIANAAVAMKILIEAGKGDLDATKAAIKVLSDPSISLALALEISNFAGILRTIKRQSTVVGIDGIHTPIEWVEVVQIDQNGLLINMQETVAAEIISPSPKTERLISQHLNGSGSLAKFITTTTGLAKASEHFTITEADEIVSKLGSDYTMQLEALQPCSLEKAIKLTSKAGHPHAFIIFSGNHIVSVVATIHPKTGRPQLLLLDSLTKNHSSYHWSLKSIPNGYATNNKIAKAVDALGRRLAANSTKK